MTAEIRRPKNALLILSGGHMQVGQFKFPLLCICPWMTVKEPEVLTLGLQIDFSAIGALAIMEYASKEDQLYVI